MQRMGFDEVYLQDALPDGPNVVGVVDSGRPGPTLVLTGHIDTKPVCVGWTDDPYSGRLEDGKAARARGDGHEGRRRRRRRGRGGAWPASDLPGGDGSSSRR